MKASARTGVASARFGHTELVQRLLEKGADIDTADVKPRRQRKGAVRRSQYLEWTAAMLDVRAFSIDRKAFLLHSPLDELVAQG